MSLSKDLAQKLLQINAIRLRPQNPFKWASGWNSPIYCDNRLSLSHPEIRNLVKNGLMELSNSFEDVDAVVGVATAGIPHGALLADALNLPFSYVRSKSKEHGRQNQIEGELKEGQKVLIVEDLISTGGSAMSAIRAVRNEGIQVLGLLAIFTYNFPVAESLFQKESVEWKTILSYEDMLEEATNLSYISPDDLSHLQAWRQNPSEWHPNS